MKRAGRLTLVLVLSSAAHVLPWIVFGEEGQQAAGGTGQEAITLVAVPENLGETVEKWLKPTEAQQQIASHKIPTETSPQLPTNPSTPRAPDLSALAPAIAPPTPDTDAAPQMTTRPSQPPTPLPPAEPSAVFKPNAPSTPQRAEQAKGAAQSEEQGNRGKAKASTGNSNREASLLRQWGSVIRQRIERQKRQSPGSGEIRLRLAVHGSGKLASVKILGQSGPKVLGAAALAAVKRARLPKAPSGVSQGPHVFSLVLRFKK